MNKGRLNISNKTLTDKKRELLKELRQYPLKAEEILEKLSIKEIKSLYYKVDTMQEEEGKSKRDLGVLDEAYMFEWSRVKNMLLIEYSKRTQMRRKNVAITGLLLIIISVFFSIFSFFTGSTTIIACNALVTSIGALTCSVASYKYDFNNL